MPTSWSREEVEATVADYLHMWLLEQAGQAYNKTTHRKALLRKLNNRTEAAVELKHQNISAILIEHGWQYIAGYKPRGNYQGLLAEVVAERMMADRKFDLAAEVASGQPAVVPLVQSIADVMVDRPRLQSSAQQKRAPYFAANNPQLKRDYIDREARNSSLGKAGEEFVVQFEQRRLHDAGQKKLAEKVEHSAATRGDGLGFDVESFEVNGAPRFIEVKTTAWGKETPFFITRNELAFSKDHNEAFHLYRLFEFRKQPKMFDLPGAVERHCVLDPVTYIGRFS
ncbi:MAG: DUF3883 domain-containing protein [Rhodocyclaceae bacterium]|nr:DUF3883 domain-containing protein [Rhodocyclaceae bacterium]